MPSRYDVFTNGAFYHIFNKTIENIQIFSTDAIAREFEKTFLYYRSTKIKLRFSLFKKLDYEMQKNAWIKFLFKKDFKVDILSYCLMPNHYHFLLRQVQDKGIQKFMANILNSITRYYNILNDRKGPIFLTQFKSKRIYTEEQLVYVSRYIHTNPYAGSLTNKNGIFTYPYSSIQSYINGINPYKISTQEVLNYFLNKRDKYRGFILKNAEDQKEKNFVKYTKRLF